MRSDSPKGSDDSGLEVPPVADAAEEITLDEDIDTIPFRFEEKAYEFSKK